MPRNQIFISHSAKDKEISSFFIRKFGNTSVKPVLMEYEKWSRNNRPNWKWIKDEIQKSSALFLVLTKNLVKNEYTQNWISFEIEVAATSHPTIPIFVFREHNIDFPVPPDIYVGSIVCNSVEVVVFNMLGLFIILYNIANTAYIGGSSYIVDSI